VKMMLDIAIVLQAEKSSGSESTPAPDIWTWGDAYKSGRKLTNPWYAVTKATASATV
jgi:hypothetical protein